MKKIICFIFGHLSPYTYNSGTPGDPEQAWACSYCHKKLEYRSEFWGLRLSTRLGSFLFKSKNKVTEEDIDMPF